MIRILMTAIHLDAGGVETFITGIYPYIDKQKYQIDFVITKRSLHNDPKGYFEDDLIKQGAKIYRIASKSKHPVYAFFDWIKLIKKHPEYEILHINDGGGAVFPLFIAKMCGLKKCIVHAHNSSSTKIKQNLAMKIFRKYVLKNAALVACAKDAGDWMFGKNATVNVLHYGIDTELFQYSKMNREEIRNMYGIGQNDMLIGHVGRFNVQKNHTFLIDIFKDICRIKPNAKLMLIGTGELEESIKEKVNQLGLDKNVIFVGNTKEVYKFLSAMDIYLFPSLFEGFSISFIEAQCNGLSTVLSNTLTKECLITNRAKMIDLHADSQVWAKEVIDEYEKINIEDRINYCLEVRKQGFDRKSTAENLEKIYRGL